MPLDRAATVIGRLFIYLLEMPRPVVVNPVSHKNSQSVLQIVAKRQQEYIM
jgi:hypothetical protein